MERYEDISAINWSQLQHMARSPKAYRWALEHPRADTPSLLLGRAVHCAVLEPGEFETRYVCAAGKRCAAMTKKGDRCTNSALALSDHCGVHGGQAEAEVYRIEHPGVEVLDSDQAETVRCCAEAVRACPDAAELLSGAAVEQTATWTDAATGVACKGRFDALCSPRHVADLKTCRDLGRFSRDAAELLYHGKMAWYLDGGISAGLLDPRARAWIIAVESPGPHDVAEFEIAGAELLAGRALYRRLLETWVSCRETGDWYGRYPTPTRLELPRWAPGMDGDEEEVI